MKYNLLKEVNEIRQMMGLVNEGAGKTWFEGTTKIGGPYPQKGTAISYYIYKSSDNKYYIFMTNAQQKEPYLSKGEIYNNSGKGYSNEGEAKKIIDTQLLKNNINEQSEEIPEYQLQRIKEFTDKGYVDVTDSFKKDEYVLEIPDGKNYKAEGSGYVFEILTDDDKTTGYVVLLPYGIRGSITGDIEVYDNGIMVNFGEFNTVFTTNDTEKSGRFLYNKSLNQVKK